MHYSSSGIKIGDGFKLELTGTGEPLGIAVDPVNNTLWIMDNPGYKLLHYSVTGKKLGEGFDVLHSGCNDGRGLAYDPRDNSLWIVNHAPHKMIHVNKNGDELPGSFYFDNLLGLPDGVALDYKGFEFRIGVWGTKRGYRGTLR